MDQFEIDARILRVGFDLVDTYLDVEPSRMSPPKMLVQNSFAMAAFGRVALDFIHSSSARGVKMRLVENSDYIARLPEPTAAAPWCVLLSGCMAGWQVGVDGTDYGMGAAFADLKASDLVEFVAFCPEDYGLGTPRTMPDIHGGDGHDVLDGDARVLDEHGADLSEGMLVGARAMAEFALEKNVHLAILTDMSGACGTQVISDGCRYDEPRKYQAGVGVAAAALIRAGVPVVSQRDYYTLGLLRARLGLENPHPDRPDHHETEWFIENLGAG